MDLSAAVGEEFACDFKDDGGFSTGIGFDANETGVAFEHIGFGYFLEAHRLGGAGDMLFGKIHNLIVIRFTH